MENVEIAENRVEDVEIADQSVQDILPSPKKPPKRKRAYYKLFGKSYSFADTKVGLAFLAPALVLGIIFVVTPIVISLSYAFTEADIYNLGELKWVGFDNFVKAFADDPLFWTALKNSVVFTVCVVPLQLLLAFGLALILNTNLKGNTFFRWAFFVPVMLSLAVTSMLWMNLLASDGIINNLIVSLGGSPQGFLSDPDQALFVIVFISAWQGAGYQMLIFLSGLKNVPKEIYEAAELDGANKVQTLFHITIPAIKPTFSFVFITMLIGAFRLITQPMIMTSGGPDNATLTLSYYIYNQGVVYEGGVGYSSAMALIYTVFMSAIALTSRKFLEKDNTI